MLTRGVPDPLSTINAAVRVVTSEVTAPFTSDIPDFIDAPGLD